MKRPSKFQLFAFDNRLKGRISDDFDLMEETGILSQQDMHSMQVHKLHRTFYRGDDVAWCATYPKIRAFLQPHFPLALTFGLVGPKTLKHRERCRKATENFDRYHFVIYRYFCMKLPENEIADDAGWTLRTVKTMLTTVARSRHGLTAEGARRKKVGRGGRRPGAGRPKLIKDTATKTLVAHKENKR